MGNDASPQVNTVLRIRSILHVRGNHAIPIQKMMGQRAISAAHI
jgi:hypothetical protein